MNLANGTDPTFTTGSRVASTSSNGLSAKSYWLYVPIEALCDDPCTSAERAYRLKERPLFISEVRSEYNEADARQKW